ncbi:MAG: Asp-tRNA(Asn)/Glu-tRNA(Gln) amidotransferase subunit GatB [Candidatus Omnitrophica bacterium]|nr:Asp-tRNA(Asn)/Glu-tRNA(Gln) amidotransferase subunit GatB [Candidatus Omnitrophota bacterium]
MAEYETVIGLEVHVQLMTDSKVFCACSTKFGLQPNSSTCEVCLGMPGVLPVLNEKAFLFGLKVGLALNCEIQKEIKFDRKNYYYPDLPKNYQISQYDKPLAYNGYLEIEIDGGKKRIGITRVHLEEDAGKLIHDYKAGAGYVDLNRAGIPLLEIVSDPEMRSPEEADRYLQNLKTILQYLKVSDCNMEEGSLRCDANISVRAKGEKQLGVKTELKNMNSFKSVRDALSYEAKRQAGLLANGETPAQETRLWNEERGVTLSMRTKEESHDYRYFPEPDLVPFIVEAKTIAEIRNSLPELPAAKRERFVSSYSLSEYEAAILVRNAELAAFFEKTISIYKNPKTVANWLLGGVASILNEKKLLLENALFTPAHLAELLILIDSEEISGKMAKGILEEAFAKGVSPQKLVTDKGLKQIKDSGRLELVIDDVLKENPKSVEDFKKGKKNAKMFLVGQVMKKTSGKANPAAVDEILGKKLDSA